MNALQQIMPNNMLVQKIMQAPNVLGYVHCSETGDVLAQEGKEVDLLANVIIYFQQMAALIGESMGLEDFQEAQIQGKALTVITLPCDGGALGVILNNRARVTEVVGMLRELMNG